MEIIMKDTKEKILNTALKLFARDGYEAVSVSMIAGELGMTKSALYKHYKNKRDIFDSIVERMYQTDRQRSEEYNVPENEYTVEPTGYETIAPENIAQFTMAQFSFWTEDEFASSFRRMLTLEQYRNAEIAKLYCDCIVSGPVQYTADIFREMIKRGILTDADPQALALEFYSPLYLLINLYDHSGKSEKLKEMLKSHIEHFFQVKRT